MSTKKKQIVYFFFVLTFFFSFIAPVFSADDAGTLKKGQFTVESDYEIVNNKNGDQNRINYYYLRYGIANNLQIEVSKSYKNIVSKNGPSTWITGDTAGKLKYRFQNETKRSPALALQANWDLDDGGSSTPSHYLLQDYGLEFIATKHLAPDLDLHTNLGYQVNDDDPANLNFMGYAVTLYKPFFKDKMSIEAGVQGISYPSAPGLLEAQVCTVYNFNSNVCLEFDYTWGLNKPAPINHYQLDFSVNF